MKTLVVANWKLNPATQKEAKNLFEEVKNRVRNAKNVEVVICPPFVYLPSVVLKKGKLVLGAQNVFFREKGAFTGEVSPLMLKDLNVKYVIIGHSETRKHLGETNEIINKKINEALTAKLKPIFCVGENEREDKFSVLDNQIKEGLKGILGKDIKNVVIAYEPVWAIGTGKNSSVDETLSSILFIRKIIKKLYNIKAAENIKILYGGSIDHSNAALYVKEGGANGLLVGGASLNGKEFADIVKSVN